MAKSETFKYMILVYQTGNKQIKIDAKFFEGTRINAEILFLIRQNNTIIFNEKKLITYQNILFENLLLYSSSTYKLYISLTKS